MYHTNNINALNKTEQWRKNGRVISIAQQHAEVVGSNPGMVVCKSCKHLPSLMLSYVKSFHLYSLICGILVNLVLVCSSLYAYANVYNSCRCYRYYTGSMNAWSTPAQ